jgi:sigma-B regulation protein RsbU (phosphoserine phosphatase)
MNPQDPSLALLRENVADIVLGSVFFFVGMTACLLAILRHRSEFRVLLWTGLFIGFYGTRMLAQVTGALQIAPHSPWPTRIEIGVNYVLIIPALLFWVELCTGALKRVFLATTLVAALVATLGLSWYVFFAKPYAFLRVNSLLAIFLLFMIGVLVLIPAVARKYLTIQSRLLRFIMPAIACLSVFVNVRWYFGVPPPHYIEPVIFVGWIAALGYEAAKHTFDKERRLLSIESELETARQIQSSILPDHVPSVAGLRVAASYQPMSAVAGDFYYFVEVNRSQTGILVADVTGHGVPAALIASMIKVAMQSASAFACEPSQVLQCLNRVLTPELRGRLTSAAYLWLDAESGHGRYSAAGHPPLLWWNAAQNELRRIESNGLLFGIECECIYPACDLRFAPGDRFLLYTDGLIEPENSQGEAFGDRRLEEVVGTNRELAAARLAERLISAVKSWQTEPAAQQDDITLVVADAV